MTKHQLETGLELSSNIESLKNALLRVQRNHMFDLYEDACTRRGGANVFLSTLNVAIEKMAVEALVQEIEKRESELRSL